MAKAEVTKLARIKAWNLILNGSSKGCDIVEMARVVISLLPAVYIFLLFALAKIQCTDYKQPTQNCNIVTFNRETSR